MKHSDEINKLVHEYMDESSAFMTSMITGVLSGDVSINSTHVFREMCAIHKKFANDVKKLSYIMYIIISANYFFRTIPIRFQLLKIDFQKEHYRKFILASLTAYIVFFILAITYILVMVLK